MANRTAVRLGRFGGIVCSGARWADEDGYPGWQVWANELEHLCMFLEGQREFHRFLPRLRDQTREHRNAALGEIRAAFVLANTGFQITAWEPVAVPGRPGDLEVVIEDNATRIFVETKAPTWQGEVWKDGTCDEDFKRDRVKKEKYLAFEGGAVGPVVTPMNIVRDNAVPKLADDRPNLVVIADDMKVSPVGVPGLAEQVNKITKGGGFERVGAVMFIDPDPIADDVIYRMQFVENASALPLVRLPEAAARLLAAEETRSLNDRKREYVSALDVLGP
jgi:hypothetical protein